MSQSSALSFGPSWMRPKISSAAPASDQPDSKTASDQDPDSSNPQSATPAFNVKDALANSKTIVPNDKSRSYTLEEMFQVFEKMKASGELIPQESREIYLNSKPSSILHVVLSEEAPASSTAGNDASALQKDHQKAQVNGASLNQAFDNLSLNGSSKVPLSSADNNIHSDDANITSVAASSAWDTNSVANDPNLSNTSSPALNSNSLLHRISSKSLLNSIHSPHAPPPGLFSAPPESINWFYLDPSNQEQGPFNGPLMQSWYSQGYLSHNLQVRRAEEPVHYPLSQFVNKVQNSYQPFLIPLPPIAQGHPNHQHHTYPPHLASQGSFVLDQPLPQPQSAFFGGGVSSATNTPGAVSNQTSNFFQANTTGGSAIGSGGASGDPNLLDSSNAFQSPSLTSNATWGTSRSNLIQPTWTGLGSSVRPSMINSSSLSNIAAAQDFGLSDGTGIPSRLGNQSPFYSNPLSVTNSFTSINNVSPSGAAIPASQQAALSVENTGNSSFIGGSNSPSVVPDVLNNNINNSNLASTIENDLKQGSFDQDHISSLLLSSVLKEEEFEKPVAGSDRAPPKAARTATAVPAAEPLIKSTISTLNNSSNTLTSEPVKSTKKDDKTKTKKSAKESKKETVERPKEKAIAKTVPSTAEKPQQAQATPMAPQQKPQKQNLANVLSTSSSKEDVSSPILEKLVPSVSTTKSNLAPWAAKTLSGTSKTSASGKKLTLREIQELEAAEKRKEEKLLEQQKAAQRTILFSEAEDEKKAAVPTLGTAGWASAAKQSKSAASPVPARTLLDIQREEAAKKRAASSAAAAAKNAASFANATGADNSKAPTSAAATASNDGSWTVVASNAAKKPSTTTKVQYKVSNPSSSKMASPAQLRSVSAAAGKPATTLSAALSGSAPSLSSVAAGASSSSTSVSGSGPASTSSSVAAAATGSKQRRDFLAWCRAELRDLNRGVNREELLRMFFMFPCSSDSRDLIQDTIYSSSKTIHGRRFADEFIKRRRGVEKYVNSWDDALNMDPDDSSEDEWVVTTSKKKNRR